MTEPIDKATKKRIEKEAMKYIDQFNNIAPKSAYKVGYISGATAQQKELASLREQLAKKEELITSIRHKLYDRDTDDAIIHEIGQLLTEGGYPYETED